jgi:uncharacterized protein with PIN domain
MATATIALHGDLQFFTKLRSARFTGEPSIKDVIESIGVPHPEIDLVVLDGAAITLEAKARDGITLELYPVREGPDLAPRLVPNGEPRFVLDGHLGKLARILRLLGFDTWWDRNPPDELLAELSSREDRILLTRDLGCLKRGIVRRGAFVRSTEQVQQGREVVKRFELAGRARPFTRCLSCNGRLVEATAEEASALVPARVLERHQRFLRCAECRHFYWSGSHHDRLRVLMDRVLTDPHPDALPKGGGAIDPDSAPPGTADRSRR